LRSPDALAALVAVNITPLAGIMFLGWQPAGVLISYAVDTYIGFLTVILLLMIHVTGDEHDTPIAEWRRWGNLIGALVFFAASYPRSAPVGAARGDRDLCRGVDLLRAVSRASDATRARRHASDRLRKGPRAARPATCATSIADDRCLR
jgi:Family of unknown function (DUF6498)